MNSELANVLNFCPPFYFFILFIYLLEFINLVTDESLGTCSLLAAGGHRGAVNTHQETQGVEHKKRTISMFHRDHRGAVNAHQKT